VYIEGNGIRVRLIGGPHFHSSSLGLSRIERLQRGEIRKLKHETAESVKEIFLGIERRAGAGVWCYEDALAGVKPMPVIKPFRVK